MDEKEQSTTVHVTRSSSPAKLEISPEVALKHERSKKLHPEISLTPGEYVVCAIKRTPIGIIVPIATGLLFTALGLFALFEAEAIVSYLAPTIAGITSIFVIIPALAVVAFALIASAVSFYVYTNNRMYVTNESVIQIIQVSLFSRREQVASLGSVEDCSMTKDTFLENLFDYGHVRLSTVGEETTYSFSYAPRPRYYMEIINSTVEAYKNGRAIPEESEVN